MGYDQEDSDEPGGGKSLWFREPGFWLILLGFILLILAAATNIWGTAELKRTAFAGENLIILGLLAWAGIGYIKHKSPKFICENYKTTIHPLRNWLSGPYIIIRAGGLFWGPINTSGSEGTVIVPATSNYPIGSSGFASKCSVYPVRYVELPLDIQEKVQAYGLLPPFLWGIKSEEQKLLEGEEIIGGQKIRNPDLQYIWQVMKGQNIMNTEIKALLQKGMVGAAEELISAGSRIAGKADRGSFAKSMKRHLWKKDEEK